MCRAGEVQGHHGGAGGDLRGDVWILDMSGKLLLEADDIMFLFLIFYVHILIYIKEKVIQIAYGNFVKFLQ